MGMQDRDYYWEDRSKTFKKPNFFQRRMAALWLLRYRISNRWARLHWLFQIWIALLIFILAGLVFRFFR